MAKSSTGIHGKYKVTRTDGTRISSDACLFVLRLDSDEHSRKAMRAYAKSCRKDNPKLAEEIGLCLDELERPPCGCREAMCPHSSFGTSYVWRYGDEG